MNNWTVGKRIFATCATLVVLAGLIGAIGFWGTRQMGGDLNSLSSKSLPGVVALTSVRVDALEIRGSTLLLALPGLTAYKAKQASRISDLESQISETLHNYEHSVLAEERPLYEKVKADTNAFLKTCARYRELTAAGKVQEASEFWLQTGAIQWPALRDDLSAETKLNAQNAEMHVSTALDAWSTATRLTWCLLGLAIALGVGLGYAVGSSINRALRRSSDELRSGVEQIAGASAQVAAASEELAQGASEQSATLEETSASGQELSAMTQRNAEHSRSAAALMTDVDRKVAEANQRLEQLISSMNEISTSSERIAKIIKVIDEIAFQTNILALNAAVEAARAGEAGMGFAVVADEVRRLAQRCAEAAKNTTSLIEESVGTAQSGSARLQEVAEAMRGITENAAKVKVLIDEVSHGAVEQARGIEQISSALTQMETVTQQTAASSEQGASASQELRAQAESMQHIVIGLEALVSSDEEAYRVPSRTGFRRSSFASTKRPEKPDLLSLQRAVGVRRKPAPQTGQAVSAAKSASAIPLDDAEFQEF